MVLRFQVSESCPRDRLGCSPALEPLQQDANEQADAPACRCFPLPSAVSAEQLQCCCGVYIYIFLYKSCS